MYGYSALLAYYTLRFHHLHFFHFFSEPFMEAMPQLVVQLCLWEAKLIPLNWIFWTTSLSSIMSTCWAFAKLLKVGPCQLLPKRKFGFGIVMVFLSVASAIAFKVYVLFSGIAFSNKPRWIQISVWVSLCLLPSLVLVIKTKYVMFT
jgi:hypothetical protein